MLKSNKTPIKTIKYIVLYKFNHSYNLQIYFKIIFVHKFQFSKRKQTAKSPPLSFLGRTFSPLFSSSSHFHWKNNSINFIEKSSLTH